MNKAEVLAVLEASRESLLDAIDGLSEGELQQPGVIDGWSVKDILIHLTRWEAELVKLLWQAKQGIRPTSIHFSGASVDEINAGWFGEHQQRPLDLILDDFHGVRLQTIRRVEAFSDKDFSDPQRFSWLGDEPLWKWIANDSFEHEAEHMDQIRTWRQKEIND